MEVKPCEIGKRKSYKPFGSWRKPLMTYAATCRDLKSIGATRAVASGTPLSPSLYSDPRTAL